MQPEFFHSSLHFRSHEICGALRQSNFKSYTLGYRRRRALLRNPASGHRHQHQKSGHRKYSNVKAIGLLLLKILRGRHRHTAVRGEQGETKTEESEVRTA